MTGWSHLPNAAHIDALLANLGLYPGEFSRIYRSVRTAARTAARNAAKIAARNAVQQSARYASRIAVLNAAWDAAWIAARDAPSTSNWDMEWTGARGAACEVILAFVAYDHCARYLTMTPDELQVWGELSSDPACILLLPYVTLLEKVKSH